MDVAFWTMPQKKKCLNHHSASVLPYYQDPEGILRVVLERKDPCYKPPFFDSGFTFIGGNWQKGVNDDKSPEEVVLREIDEEFWMRYEAPEWLNQLLGEAFLKQEPFIVAKYSQKAVNSIKAVRDVLYQGLRHAADFEVTVNPPVTKKPLVYGTSIFAKELSQDEFSTIEDVIAEFEGVVTTDNLVWGGRLMAVSLADINQQNMKFAWGYDHIMNSLLGTGLPPQQQCVFRTLDLVSVKKMAYAKDVERSASGCPTFDGFESLGYKYSSKQVAF
jgi:hypothetical protein